MIRLRNNPIEGSAVRLALSFRDGFGNYYVPSSVTYTILALNNDEESWSVVDDVYKKKLEPASTMTVTTPVSKVIEGTTLRRKIVFEWTTLVDGTYTDFVDEASYEVQPMPYVPDHPLPPAPEEPDLEVTDIKFQIGSVVSAPVYPVFLVRFNQPVIPDSGASFIQNEDGVKYHVNVEADLTYSVLTISCMDELQYNTHYDFVMSDYHSRIGTAEMKEDFKLSFLTTKSGNVQQSKTVDVTENGETEVLPDTGYSSMGKVVLNVAVPGASVEENKSFEIHGEGTFEVVPTIGFDAMAKVTVEVSIPNQIALYCYIDNDTPRQFWFSREVDGEGEYLIMPVNIGGSFKQFSSHTVAVDMTGQISFVYDGNTVLVERYEAGDIVRA